MKKINKTILYLVLTLFLYSCNSLSDAGKTLRNEKVRTTDEFLVEKREPLALPPDYKTLPEPGSNTLNKDNNNKNEISKILKIEKKKVTKKGSSSVEQSIINEIRK